MSWRDQEHDHILDDLRNYDRDIEEQARGLGRDTDYDDYDHEDIHGGHHRGFLAEEQVDDWHREEEQRWEEERWEEERRIEEEQRWEMERWEDEQRIEEERWQEEQRIEDDRWEEERRLEDERRELELQQEMEREFQRQLDEEHWRQLEEERMIREQQELEEQFLLDHIIMDQEEPFHRQDFYPDDLYDDYQQEEDHFSSFSRSSSRYQDDQYEEMAGQYNYPDEEISRSDAYYEEQKFVGYSRNYEIERKRRQEEREWERKEELARKKRKQEAWEKASWLDRLLMQHPGQEEFFREFYEIQPGQTFEDQLEECIANDIANNRVMPLISHTMRNVKDLLPEDFLLNYKGQRLYPVEEEVAELPEIMKVEEIAVNPILEKPELKTENLTVDSPELAPEDDYEDEAERQLEEKAESLHEIWQRCLHSFHSIPRTILSRMFSRVPLEAEPMDIDPAEQNAQQPAEMTTRVTASTADAEEVESAEPKTEQSSDEEEKEAASSNASVISAFEELYQQQRRRSASGYANPFGSHENGYFGARETDSLYQEAFQSEGTAGEAYLELDEDDEMSEEEWMEEEARESERMNFHLDEEFHRMLEQEFQNDMEETLARLRMEENELLIEPSVDASTEEQSPTAEGYSADTQAEQINSDGTIDPKALAAYHLNELELDTRTRSVLESHSISLSDLFSMLDDREEVQILEQLKQLKGIGEKRSREILQAVRTMHKQLLQSLQDDSTQETAHTSNQHTTELTNAQRKLADKQLVEDYWHRLQGEAKQHLTPQQYQQLVDSDFTQTLQQELQQAVDDDESEELSVRNHLLGTLGELDAFVENSKQLQAEFEQLSTLSVKEIQQHITRASILSPTHNGFDTIRILDLYKLLPHQVHKNSSERFQIIVGETKTTSVAENPFDREGYHFPLQGIDIFKKMRAIPSRLQLYWQQNRHLRVTDVKALFLQLEQMLRYNYPLAQLQGLKKVQTLAIAYKQDGKINFARASKRTVDKLQRKVDAGEARIIAQLPKDTKSFTSMAKRKQQLQLAAGKKLQATRMQLQFDRQLENLEGDLLSFIPSELPLLTVSSKQYSKLSADEKAQFRQYLKNEHLNLVITHPRKDLLHGWSEDKVRIQSVHGRSTHTLQGTRMQQLGRLVELVLGINYVYSIILSVVRTKGSSHGRFETAGYGTELQVQQISRNLPLKGYNTEFMWYPSNLAMWLNRQMNRQANRQQSKGKAHSGKVVQKLPTNPKTLLKYYLRFELNRMEDALYKAIEQIFPPAALQKEGLLLHRDGKTPADVGLIVNFKQFRNYKERIKVPVWDGQKMKRIRPQSKLVISKDFSKLRVEDDQGSRWVPMWISSKDGLIINPEAISGDRIELEQGKLSNYMGVVDLKNPARNKESLSFRVLYHLQMLHSLQNVRAELESGKLDEKLDAVLSLDKQRIEQQFGKTGIEYWYEKRTRMMHRLNELLFYGLTSLSDKAAIQKTGYSILKSKNPFEKLIGLSIMLHLHEIKKLNNVLFNSRFGGDTNKNKGIPLFKLLLNLENSSKFKESSNIGRYSRLNNQSLPNLSSSQRGIGILLIDNISSNYQSKLKNSQTNELLGVLESLENIIVEDRILKLSKDSKGIKINQGGFGVKKAELEKIIRKAIDMSDSSRNTDKNSAFYYIINEILSNIN